MNIELRDVTEADLPIFFAHQLDAAANRMAAFTTKQPGDEDAFMARWRVLLSDESIVARTIVFEGVPAGYVASFLRRGTPEVSYWLGREHWGKGIATRALASFLSQIAVRPLYARAARDNVASIRVLEKCGFRISGRDPLFANARGEEIDEVIMMLET